MGNNFFQPLGSTSSQLIPDNNCSFSFLCLLLLQMLAPASSSSSLFWSSTSQENPRFGCVLPGWKFSWGFQHLSQSKTDWGFSEIALSFIRFFPASKGFQQQVNSTSPTSNREGRAKSWSSLWKNCFEKARGRRRRGTFKPVFDTFTIF